LIIPVFGKIHLVGAVSAKLLTEKLNPEFLDNAFFMGLLQNIGTLTFAHCMPAQYNLVLSEMEKTSSEHPGCRRVHSGIQPSGNRGISDEVLGIARDVIYSCGLPS
jgi:hypothetical protein